MDPIEYLFSLEFHGIKLGLDNITALLSAMDSPQDANPTVHVGGTNGKGSTVAFLDRILRESGYTVGRFTSPHLCTVHERFIVNGTPISDDELRTLIEEIRSTLAELDLSPTFFEVNTAIAFEYFKRKRVDIALIEVGMGGRFDSTNVITPKLSIITNIALEHTLYLGDTIEKIAFEKAGILKPGVPAILGNLVPEAHKVIVARANELSCPTSILGETFHARNDYVLGLPGAHQAENAALAIEAANTLRTDFPNITDDAIRDGLAGTSWPCRMETVLSNPEVVIDVAHNPACAETLARELNRPHVILLAIAADKDAKAMVGALESHAERIFVSEFDGPRALPATDLALHVAAEIPVEVITPLEDAIDAAIDTARTIGCPLLITGSLFTAGQARRHLMKAYNAAALRF